MDPSEKRCVTSINVLKMLSQCLDFLVYVTEIITC